MRTSSVILLVLCLGSVFAQSEFYFNNQVQKYMSTQSNFCWKSSYGRGVGTIPNDCGEGKEIDAGLCYPVCAPGYKGVGSVCWQFPKSYGRGAGKAPTICPSGKQYDAGRCYPYCSSGMTGVGPVCWKSCSGLTSTDCGAACATDTQTCLSNIFEQVKAVLNMIKDLYNIAENKEELETSKEVALQTAFKLAKLFIKKGYSKPGFINFMKKAAMKAGTPVNEATLNMLYEKASIKDLIKLELEVIAKTDPTGIARVILAFFKDVC